MWYEKKKPSKFWMGKKRIMKILKTSLFWRIVADQTDIDVKERERGRKRMLTI